MQLPNSSFQDFLNVDSNICREDISDGAIISNFINENKMEFSDQEEKELTPTPILKQIAECLWDLSNYLRPVIIVKCLQI